MAYCALTSVATAVYTTLNVSALTTLAPGGVHEDVAQGNAFPFVWFECEESRQLGGFGTKPGTKMLPEIGLRVHVFSTYQGMREAHLAMQKAIELLKDAPAVTGYSSWAIFHDGTIALPDEELGGQKVRELVALFRLYVEET